MKKHNVLFINNHALVQVSSDPFGISMSLVAHEISVADQSCLLVPDLAAQADNETQSFPARITLPYGYNNDFQQLKRRCLEYVNSVSKYPLDKVGNIIGDTSGLVWGC